MRVTRSDFTANDSLRTFAFLFAGLIVVGLLGTVATATAAVKLNAWTTPDNGVPGVNHINLTGSAFPNEIITPGNVSISLASSCGESAVAATTATSVKSIIGTSERVDFVVPSGLQPATYFVSISDSADSIPFASTNCSEVKIAPINPVLRPACLAAR